MDNAPVHPSNETLTSRDGKVKAQFLPANTTSVIQHMDQGILETTKMLYKKHRLRHLILENEACYSSVPDLLKGIIIKNGLYWNTQSWEELSSNTLR